jgi:hypothetical protein
MYKLLTVAMAYVKRDRRCDVVRKIHGTPWLREGWKAHEHGMFCSCASELYRLLIPTTRVLAHF